MTPGVLPERKKILWWSAALFLFLALTLVAFSEMQESHFHAALLASLLLTAVFMVFLERDYRSALRRQQEDIERLMGLKLVLTSLIDLKDPYTEGHSRKVRDLAHGFCLFLGLPPEECEQIALAAELHDIGKIGIPDAILKKPAGLQTEEYQAIQDHPLRGAEALKSLPGFEAIRTIIRHHHERFDGTGYPDGLAGQAIPLGSRIIALADSVDTMLRGRDYRPPLPLKEICTVLKKQAGKQFDPWLAEAFIQFLTRGTQAGTRDPVCGMAVTPGGELVVWEQDGRRWLFCSQTCLNAFRDHPEKYRLQPETPSRDLENNHA